MGLHGLSMLFSGVSNPLYPYLGTRDRYSGSPNSVKDLLSAFLPAHHLLGPQTSLSLTRAEVPRLIPPRQPHLHKSLIV